MTNEHLKNYCVDLTYIAATDYIRISSSGGCKGSPFFYHNAWFSSSPQAKDSYLNAICKMGHFLSISSGLVMYRKIRVLRLEKMRLCSLNERTCELDFIVFSNFFLLSCVHPPERITSAASKPAV